MPTDPRYWDCECDTNYMHPKSEPSCPECNTRSEDQPDSRINELLTECLIYPTEEYIWLAILEELREAKKKGANHKTLLLMLGDRLKTIDITPDLRSYKLPERMP